MGASKERWRAVAGYEGLYEVSDLGRVRSLPRRYRRTLKVLKPGISAEGRREFTLCRDNERWGVTAARLMLAAFVRPCPGPEYDACHNDGDPSNDALGNLRWDTRSGNLADRKKHGRRPYAPGGSRAELTLADVRRIRQRGPAETYARIGREYGITRQAVHQIVRRETYTWLP
jgi:hypothetical protein